MKTEIREQWTAALRSRDYDQGRGHLRLNGKFCCLGVLCDLAVNAGITEETRCNVEGCVDHADYEGCSAFPPKSVLEWAGLTSPDPFVVIEGRDTSLSLLNDAGESFDHIADIIDAQLADEKDLVSA